jgi:hypothetical protein
LKAKAVVAVRFITAYCSVEAVKISPCRSAARSFPYLSSDITKKGNFPTKSYIGGNLPCFKAKQFTSGSLILTGSWAEFILENNHVWLV